MDYSLMPQFRNAMNQNCQLVINNIRELLLNAAQAIIAEKKLALEELIKQQKEQKDAFANRLNAMKDYKNELLTQ